MQKVPVKEPVTEPREFSSLDEFNFFYNQNKSEIEASTTHLLNKKYRIPGYRITRIEGKVMLKPSKDRVVNNLDRIKALQDRVITLEQTISTIITSLNDVIAKCNTVTKDMKEVKAKIAAIEAKPPVIIRETAPKHENDSVSAKSTVSEWNNDGDDDDANTQGWTTSYNSKSYMANRRDHEVSMQNQGQNGRNNQQSSRNAEQKDDKKVTFNNSGPNPMKRNASPRRPGQLMETARAWLEG